jgi:hypothetical protein
MYICSKHEDEFMWGRGEEFDILKYTHTHTKKRGEIKIKVKSNIFLYVYHRGECATITSFEASWIDAAITVVVFMFVDEVTT